MTLKDFQSLPYADAVGRSLGARAGLAELDRIHAGARIDRDMQHRRTAMLKLTPTTTAKER